MTARPSDEASPEFARVRRAVEDEIDLALDEGRSVPCRDDRALFDLVIDGAEAYVPEASVRCSRCPVQRTCGELADHADHGVFGGREAVKAVETREAQTAQAPTRAELQAARDRRKKARKREAKALARSQRDGTVR